MKLLVTGGAGFMGSNFIKYILKKHPSWEVLNFDKLTYAGNLDNLREVEKNKNYKFIKGDIANPLQVKKAIGWGINCIINYAAESHVDRSILSPGEFIKTDILGTYTLLEAAKRYNVAQYIQISTDEVYGSIKRGRFSEASSFAPNSPYSASKAGADHLCRAYFVTYNLPVIVTHSCNNYGPNAHPEKMIPLFITNLLEGKKVPLYGRGKQVREWIFVEDHCRAIETLIQKGKAGETYNIGTGQEKINLETAKYILNKMGLDDKMILFTKDRPGHDFRYSLNCGKLRKLGWRPRVSWEEGLCRTISWYRKNEWWWKKIKAGRFRAYCQKQYQRR